MTATINAPANTDDLYKMLHLMSRHDELVSVLLRRPLTAAEDAEMLEIETAFDAIV
jgi:hypothetical protein